MTADPAEGAAPDTSSLRLMAELTSDIVVQTSLEGRLLFVSDASRAYGYEPSDLVGAMLHDLVHPDDLAVRLQNRAQIVAGSAGEHLETHFRFRTAQGDWVWVEGNPRVMRDAAGKPVATVNILRDVSRYRAQAELFETAFKYAATGMALVALDGRFLKVNEAFCRIIGLPEREVLALDSQRITHPDDVMADLSLARRLISGDIESCRMDKRYIRADGEPIWVQATVSMVRHADGTPNHFVAQVQDLTDQRAAEAAVRESEARYRLIADNSSDMIVITRLTGEITYLSPSLARTGWREADLIGQPFGDYMHTDDVKAVTRAFGDLLEGREATSVRWRGRHGVTGDWMWMESRPTLLRDAETGRPTAFLDAVRDITAQVGQEEALDRARQAASAAAEAKSQFLANMSHEIRTPLTAVIGFTRLLTEGDGLDSEARGFVERIGGAGRGLLSLVNDVLDFSKLEAGAFEIRARPSDAAAVCRETLEMFEPQTAAKGLDLSIRLDERIPQRVNVDSDRLRQVLTNLIGNAVKFTDEGSVTVHGAYDATSERLRVEVTDTGAGMSAAQCRSLFQQFNQLDTSATRRHGGTGLGLAICKGLAEAMGGTIGVRSKRGVGSTFFFELPAPAASPPLADATGAPSLEALEDLRILVVDDNALNRELARTLLSSLGAEVQDAGDGESAFEAATTAPFDLILMDMRMPDASGDQVLARIRQGRGPNCDIPILAFTAEAEGLDDAGGLAGFDGVVRKPIDVGELCRQVSQALEGGGPVPLQVEKHHAQRIVSEGARGR